MIVSKKHYCGDGFKGVLKTVKRPSYGRIRFCDFCGKEWKR